MTSAVPPLYTGSLYGGYDSGSTRGSWTLSPSRLSSVLPTSRSTSRHEHVSVRLGKTSPRGVSRRTVIREVSREFTRKGTASERVSEGDLLG